LAPDGQYPFHWAEESCKERRPYMCKSPKVPRTTLPPPREGACPDGWEQLGDQCYHFLPDVHVYWHTALDLCEEIDKRSTLPTITSWTQNAFILDMMRAQSSLPPALQDNYWIGLYKTKEGASRFQWISGESYDKHRHYNNWAQGEPSDTNGKEDCVEVYIRENKNWNPYEAGEWNDAYCKGNNAVVCQMPTFKPGMTSGQTAGVVIFVIILLIAISVAALFVLDKKGIIDVKAKIARMKDISKMPFASFNNENYENDDKQNAKA